ncbi:pectate lyase [Hymenobacter sp. GOD-10R]|uniref:pectate lyase n=1 Tax=Hymenobacter sp. GOD-10R TaxID=3093922 RepID=UPI002D77B667|nr:pectate lyase [Hymenobacter sp. GOD-10R]WRQ27635.1 pectate lyase [Hymenobacter sp. GOD-10R]
MSKYLFLLLLLLLSGTHSANAGAPAKRQIVVAQNGSGDFRTIQEAINSLPKGGGQLPVVFIKNGTYREKVTIDGKPGLVLRGQSEKGVVITISQANAYFRCDAANAGRWDVATLNLRDSPGMTLEQLTVVNSYGADHPNGETLACPNSPGGKITINSADHQMALYTGANTTRLVVRHCTFRTLGNDTVSPWDKEDGLYYFADCTMEGSVDFYCPRGWAYAENCRFICHNLNAAIWHDGSMNKDAKTVLKNCTFTGDKDWKLGRYHHDSQFYLVNCRFDKNMADADIYPAPSGDSAPMWGRRVYYSNCHRDGGDYAWLHDNLATASNAPTPQQITANWTFGGRWNVDPKAPKMPAPSPVAKDSIAERMLYYQRLDGGWPKAIGEHKIDYNQQLSAVQKATLTDDAGRNDATIDNNATTHEITYLLHAFTTTSNPAYRKAAEKGISYLLKMQYPNGGFPQFYPDLSSYHHQITYNDDAMIRVLRLLRAITERKGDYASVDQNLRLKAQQAVERGIDCILKTQYVQNGKLTAWCAQYDEKTLQPAKARNFELPSLSGSETVGIVEFLMQIENPSPEVKKAIDSAVAWLQEVKMPGYTVKTIKDPKQPKGFDRVIERDASSTIWARFYDLETNKPIYVGRNSEKKNSLAEIEYERRTGYGYAGTWPQTLLAKEYPEWQQKWEKK